jgi:hypothetical protein
MGSMSNGRGNDLFAVLDPGWAFYSGFDDESAVSPLASDPPKIWSGVLKYVPEQFSSSLTAPAFHMDDTTFCI